LNGWWEYLLVAQETTKNAFCQEKNGRPGISLVSTILGLGKVRISWYLAAPPIPGFVHKASIAQPPNPCKTTSTNLENGEIQPIGHFYPTFAPKKQPF